MRHIALGIYNSWPSKNSLGVSELHWVWAIAASSGPRLRFDRVMQSFSV